MVCPRLDSWFHSRIINEWVGTYGKFETSYTSNSRRRDSLDILKMWYIVCSVGVVMRYEVSNFAYVPTNPLIIRILNYQAGLGHMVILNSKIYNYVYNIIFSWSYAVNIWKHLRSERYILLCRVCGCWFTICIEPPMSFIVHLEWKSSHFKHRLLYTKPNSYTYMLRNNIALGPLWCWSEKRSSYKKTGM